MATKYPGLLVTPAEKQQAAFQGLLNLGTQMMAAGGYSDRPTSFAQALGQGGQGFMKGYQGGVDRAKSGKLQDMQAQQAQMQLQMQQDKLAKLAAQQKAGQAYMTGLQDQGPLTAEQQAIMDAGGGYQLMESNRAARIASEGAEAERLAKLQSDMALAKFKSGLAAKAGTRILTPEEQKAQGLPVMGTYQMDSKGKVSAVVSPKDAQAVKDAEAASSSAAGTYDDTINQIDKVLHMKGGQAGTGLSSFMGYVPGTEAKDFASEVEKLEAQNFLTAIKNMKGMGSLSDAEGKKVAAAEAALNRARTEEGFKQALNDLRSVLIERRNRLAAESGGKLQEFVPGQYTAQQGSLAALNGQATPRKSNNRRTQLLNKYLNKL